MITTGRYSFPIQTVPKSKKTESWFKKNVESAIKIIGSEANSSIRFSRQERDILYRLGIDELDPRDMAKTFNPMQIEDMKDSFKDIMNIPFEQGIFNLLKGEEAQRPFNYQVKRINPEAISEVNEQKRQMIGTFLQEKLDTENLDPAKVKEEIEDLMDSVANYRDIKAVRAKKLITKLETENSLTALFSQTFDSKLYVGEETLFFDFVSGNLKVQAVNDLNLYLMGAGTTNKIQDSDIIVYVDYLNPSQIIGYYRDDLSDKDIKKLYNPLGTDIDAPYEAYTPASPTFVDMGNGNMVAISEEGDTSSLGAYINDYGDIRVARVFWKGKREIKIVDTIDSEGNVTTEMLDEGYKVREELGEILNDTIYIDSWEQGTLVGSDIYVKMHTWEGNVYSKTDFTLRAHPFIGYIDTLNNKGAVSLMHTIKNIKYLYNVVNHEHEIAIGKNLGNIAITDMATLPNKEGWSIEKVYYMMKAVNMKIIDSRESIVEGKVLQQGSAGGSINLSQLESIRTLAEVLDRLRNELHDITGVTQQRLGQVSNRETKGGIERSVQQSSSTTEPLFRSHEKFKVDTYNNLLELSKILIAGGTINLSDWSDDMFQFVDKIDGEEYAESDYGISVSDSYNDIRLKGIIEELAPTLLQSELIPLSDYLNIIENNDVNYSSMIIKKAERRKERMQQNQAKQQQEAEAQMKQEALAHEQLLYDRELGAKQLELTNNELIQRLKNENALELAIINAESKQGKEEAEIQIAQNKQNMERLKNSTDALQKRRELDIREKEVKVKQTVANNKSKQ